MPSYSSFSPRKTAPLSAGADLQSDPRWQLIERILATAPFQKSTNLQALLSYLGEHSIREELHALTERQIGRAAFGKPEDYSPAEDSAVRVHVRQLRLRLHEYFACDGRNEALLVELPKGSYVLEFHSAHAEDRAQLEAPLSPELGPAKTTPIWVRQLPLFLAIAVAAVCAAGWYRAANRGVAPPVPWPMNALVRPNQETRIVVSDGNSMLRLLGNKEFTLDDYLQPSFRQSLIPSHLEPNVSRLVDYISDSELTSFVDVVVATSLVRLAGPKGESIALYPAQNLSLRDLERGNYIFIGSPISNPWVGLFADKLNFQVVEDRVGGRMYFRNKNPLPGEQHTYEGLPRTGSAGEEYATIALVPNNNGRGDVLILQGLRQEGTEAVGELLENSDDRNQLEKALRARNGGDAPEYFEALIRTRAIAGAPLSISIVSTRIIPGRPTAP